MNEPLPPGTQIGRFRLEAQVGRGGMGVVYRAVDPVLNRPVALKLLAPHLEGDASAQARFHREAEAIAGLKHPHIALVYEFGTLDGRPYMAQEWIEGRTLREILAAEGPLPLERSLRLFHQLAEALDYAHSRGVVHRDLKPANIIVSPDDTATIVDFGLAWLDTAPSITASGMIVGTPLYMSPEQIQGQPTDSRSDLYSLAIILYEMLAGRPPFKTPDTPALFQQQLYAPPPPITEHNPTLPLSIEAALNRALAKDPAARFPTAAQFERALLGPGPAPVTGTQDAPRSRPAGEQGRSRSVPWLRWGIALVLLAAFGAAAALLLPQLWPEDAPPEPRPTPPLTTAPTTAPLSTTLPTAAFAATPLPAAPISPTAALSAPVLGPDWEQGWGMVNGGPTQSRFLSREMGPVDPAWRWEFYPDVEGGTDLVAGYGRVVVAGGGGRVYALDWETGRLWWETRLGADIAATPALYLDDEDSVVIVPTEDGALYGLRLTDARLLWRLGVDALQGVITQGGIVGEDSGVVYVVTDSGWLHGLDPESGEARLSLDLSEAAPFYQAPTVTGAAIFLAGPGGAIYAIDPIRQEAAWTVELGSELTTPPVLSEFHSLLLAGTADGQVAAFSLMSGGEVWRAELSGPVFGLTLDWDRVYAATEEGRAYAWDALSGEVVWVTPLEATLAAGPFTDGLYLLVGTTDDEMRYLDAETGEERADLLWEPGETLDYAPIILGEWLFFRTASVVYAVGPP